MKLRVPRIIHCALILLSAFVFAGEEKSGNVFDLNVKDQSLESVLKILRYNSEYSVFAANPVDDAELITLEMKQTRWRQALERIAADKGYTIRSDAAWGNLILLERETKVSLHFKDSDLRDVLLNWARDSNRNIILLYDVEGDISIDVDNVPASQALAKIRAASKCEIVEGPFGVVIAMGAESAKNMKIAREAQRAYTLGTKDERVIEGKPELFNAKHKNIGGFLEKLQERASFDKFGKWKKEFRTTGVELNNVSPRGALEFAARRYGVGVDTERLGEPAIYFPDKLELVSFVFNKFDLRDTINTIAIQYGQNIVMHHEVSGVVTGRIENLPAEPVLRMVVNSLGFAAVIEPQGFLFVASADRISRQAKPVAQGRIVTITFYDTKLSDVIAHIAAKAHAEIKFADEKTKAWKVAVHLDNVPWKNAIAIVLKSVDLEMTEQPDGTFLIKHASDEPKK